MYLKSNLHEKVKIRFLSSFSSTTFQTLKAAQSWAACLNTRLLPGADLDLLPFPARSLAVKNLRHDPGNAHHVSDTL